MSSPPMAPLLFLFLPNTDLSGLSGLSVSFFTKCVTAIGVVQGLCSTTEGQNRVLGESIGVPKVAKLQGVVLPVSIQLSLPLQDLV